MDRITFERDVVEMFKETKRISSEKVPLSENKLSDYRANIHEHIDSVFPINPCEPVTPTPITSNRITSTLLDKIKRIFRNLVSFEGVAVAAAITGVLFIVISMKKPPSPFLILPDSIAAQVPYKGTRTGFDTSKAIIIGQASIRRQAFVAGVGRAELDLVGSENKEYVDSLNDSVETFAATPSTNSWLVNGYSVEIVRLAALRTLEDMDTSVIKDALIYYGAITPRLTQVQENDVPALFLEHHRFLVGSVEVDFEPADIQDIIDITEQMKVVLR